MKNIHVLPTDKPSKLYYNTKGKNYAFSNTILSQGGCVENQHIYITSDEEIKEGDWCMYLGLSMTSFKVIEIESDKLFYGSRESFNKSLCKKIILTTEQYLIKDGVQAIDDEFLEWFVKNPTCENVEVRYNVGTYNPDYLKFYEVSPPKSYYKIIIPKEETLTITLNKEEVRGLLNCIMRTSAKGNDLDVGEMVEDKLVEFLNLK